MWNHKTEMMGWIFFSIFPLLGLVAFLFFSAPLLFETIVIVLLCYLFLRLRKKK